MPELEPDDIVIEYSIDGRIPGGACVRGTCRFVRVSISYVFRTRAPFLAWSIPMPPCSMTCPVEALGAG